MGLILYSPILGGILRVTSGYGTRIDPVTHQVHTHEGIDLGVGTGTPVYASAAGVVTSEWTDGVDKGAINGNALKIDHGGGYATGYLHLSRKVVSKGAHVAAGQLIGYSGATGRATGPHLHFIVWKNGVPVDPWPLVAWSTLVASATTGVQVWLWGAVIGGAIGLFLLARQRFSR